MDGDHYIVCRYVCNAYISACIYVTVGMCTHALCAHGHIKFVNAGEECACSCVNGTGAVLTYNGPTM